MGGNEDKFRELYPLSPVETYNNLKDYLMEKSVDLSRVHITFSMPGVRRNDIPSRKEWMLPIKFAVYHT